MVAITIPVTCDRCGHTTAYVKPEVFRPSTDGAVIRDLGVRKDTSGGAGYNSPIVEIRIVTDRGTMRIRHSATGLLLDQDGA